MTDIVERLSALADGLLIAAQEEAERYGEGTEDQIDLERWSALTSEAAAEITRLRQSDAEVIIRILANTDPQEWLSKAEIHEALKAWRVA